LLSSSKLLIEFGGSFRDQSRALRPFRYPLFASDLIVTISKFVERVNDISRFPQMASNCWYSFSIVDVSLDDSLEPLLLLKSEK
jgi:hypothetical protein